MSEKIYMSKSDKAEGFNRKELLEEYTNMPESDYVDISQEQEEEQTSWMDDYNNIIVFKSEIEAFNDGTLDKGRAELVERYLKAQAAYESLVSSKLYLPWEIGKAEFQRLVEEGHKPLAFVNWMSSVFPNTEKKMIIYPDKEKGYLTNCYKYGPFESVNEAEEFAYFAEKQQMDEYFRSHNSETPFYRINFDGDSGEAPDFSKYGYKAVEGVDYSDYWSIELIEEFGNK